jgi:septal ring-binding cell division protein DamX
VYGQGLPRRMPGAVRVMAGSPEHYCHPMRRRNEPAPDEGGLTDSISLILKELRLIKKEMASNKMEFEEKLAMITQNIRSAADQDTASSINTASEETVERIDGKATDAQPKAGTPDTGGNGDSPGGNEDEEFHFQMAAERYRNVSQWAVVASTLRH